MTTYTGSKHFVGLTNIDRLAIVIEERVDAPAIVSNLNILSGRVNKLGVKVASKVGAEVSRLERWELYIVLDLFRIGWLRLSCLRLTRFRHAAIIAA